jgi:hypothetical protein
MKMKNLKTKTTLMLHSANSASCARKRQTLPLSLSRTLALTLVFALIGTTAFGVGTQWVSTGGVTQAAPSLQMLAATADQVSLEVQVPGYQTEVVKRGPGIYARISLPDSGVSAKIGEPQLPVIRRLIEVPEDAQVSVDVQGEAREVALADLGIDCPVLPRQQPVPKIPGALKTASFDLNAAAYQADAFFPTSRAALVEAGHFAGRRLVLLEMNPIACNPVRRQLSVANKLTVTVTSQGGAKTASTLSAQEDKWLAGLALNHVTAKDTPKAGGRLLIIAHTSLAPSLTAFITHKSNMGWMVDLANTTTAGTTTNAIRSYIQSRYANLATRPSALLLVGDTGQIPQFISAQTDNPDTDLYYACMDGGDDWQPEFPVGRFSVTNAAQLNAIVNKTIYYETSSPGLYATRATFMATDDSGYYPVAEGTHNWCITNYMQPRGYTSDKLYCITYSATTQQVKNALNDGRVFGIYSGHGYEGGWAGPAFSQSDVVALTNVSKYPFVCSFACLTGRYAVDECFAETWQRGTNYGAVEVLASSVYSYWDEDDILQKRLFVALFDQGHWVFGDDVMQAKYLYLQYWGATATTHRYFEQYNLFGDPTVALKAPVFSVVTASPLSPAFQNEPYSLPLMAAGGTSPYTWSNTAGALPGGLSLNPTSGLISGTPTNLGTASFTVQVTDVTSATTNKLLQLPVLARLQIACATNLTPAAWNVPYSNPLPARGGTTPYHWTLNATGGFVETSPSAGWLGGGTAKTWQADDQSWSLTLPWPFPYYGINRTSVWVCSNGYLDFGSSTADYSNSDASLLSAVRVAPLWEDLVTTGTGDDIFVSTNASYVAIRWAAHTYTGSYAVNAEVVLYRDGSVKFNYGAAQSGIGGATIGLSAGDSSHYTLSTRDNATSIPANVSSLFSRTGLLPPGLTLSTSGVISGTATQLGSYTFSLHLDDSGTPSQALDQQFRLNVPSAPNLTGFSYNRSNLCQMSFNTITGRLYCLEYCECLSATSVWVVVTNNLPGTGNPVSVCDPITGSAPRRFYRVRTW